MNASIVSDLLSGTATPDQYAGLCILAAVALGGFIALVRQHVRDTKDDARNLRGGRVRF